MTCSEAQLAANRRNSERSTGPKTAEGKAISRQNALKHGLSGQGIVLPEAELAAIETLVDGLEADLRPTCNEGQILIRRMATLSVRMDTAARQEAAARAKNVRHAADDFDEERIDHANLLFENLGQDPRNNLRKLKKMPEGIDRLIAGWEDLRLDLIRDPKPVWTAAHMEQAANMIGLRTVHARASKLGALCRGFWGDFDGLTHDEGGHLREKARQTWAKDQLIERIDLEIATLEAHRLTLDSEMIELDRAEAGDRALFDTSKEAILARRYEASAQSGFIRAMKEFRNVEAEFLEHAQFATPSAPAFPLPPVIPPETQDQLGSSRRAASLPLPVFDPGSPEWRSDPEWVVRGPDGEPLQIARPVGPPV